MDYISPLREMDDVFEDDMDLDIIGFPTISTQSIPRERTSSAAQYLSHDVLHYMFAVCYLTLRDQQLSSVLSHVCRSWRFTALASPFLWTEIYMNCKRRNPHHLLVQTRLKRAKNLLISLHVNSLRPFEESELNTIIIPNAYRIRKLVIIASSDLLIPLLFKGLIADMPLLSQFTFHVKGQKDGSRLCFTRDPGPYDIALNAPIRVPPVTRHIHIAWSDWEITNLTAFTLDYFPEAIRPTVKDVHRIFSRNQSSLKRISFRGFAPELQLGGDDDDDSWLTVINLPALTTLNIGYLHATDYAAIVITISAPNLVSLALRDMYRHPEIDTPPDVLTRRQLLEDGQLNDASALIALLTASQSITNLILIGVEADEPLCVQFMQSMTNLQTVVLYNTEPAFFQTIWTSLPPPSASTSAPYPGKALSRLVATDTSVVTVLAYLALRTAANLPRMEKLTLTQDCVSPVHWQSDLRLSLLGRLALSADVVTVIPPPSDFRVHIPWQEHGLLRNGVLNHSTWSWLGPSPTTRLFNTFEIGS